MNSTTFDSSVLRPQKQIMLPAVMKVDPRKQIVESTLIRRKVIDLWLDLPGRILKYTNELEGLPAREVTCFSLLRTCDLDSDIIRALPEEYYFKDLSTAWAYIYEILKQQADGCEGDLSLVHRNIFYYFFALANAVCRIEVDWCRHNDGHWILNHGGGNNGGPAGTQVFCATNVN